MLDDLEFLESYLITEYDAEIVWGKDEEDAYYYDVNRIGLGPRVKRTNFSACFTKLGILHCERMKTLKATTLMFIKMAELNLVGLIPQGRNRCLDGGQETS